MDGRHWIERAIKKPGTLKKQARSAGESTAEFAKEHEKDSGKIGKRARLTETLMKMRKGK